MTLKETLFNLSALDAVGNVSDAADLAQRELSIYCQTERMNNLTVVGLLKGDSDYTVMLDAHIDQIAMIVTNVDDNGFLTVQKSGGIDLRALPSRRVTVHGKQKISAVFCSTPPHLASGEAEFDDITKLKIDTALGQKARELVSVGDYVTFSGEPRELTENILSGRSFDDRAGVACLLEIAKRLSGEKLPVSVAFVLSDGEELGLRGTRTAAFKVNPNESIAVDVSFGDGVGISDEECGKLGKGAMLGLSPVLDRQMAEKMKQISTENNIPLQTEVMGASTGTNADMISVSREGVKTLTLSIPLRNMHTEVEVLDIADLESLCELVCEYILGGGVNA